MKERVIGIEAVDNSDSIIKDYIIKKIVNGEIEKITVSNDTKKFQELLKEYQSFLTIKKGNLLKELNPKKIISNLKTNVLATYLIVSALAFIYCLFILSGITPLRIVGFSSMGIGGALMTYFAYLDYKYDTPTARQELKEIENLLKEYEKMYEKAKMAMIERETINKKNSVSDDIQNKKQRVYEETKDVSNKSKFKTDRPSFMKNLEFNKNVEMFYNDNFNLKNFSREPLRYRPNNTGQFAHAHSNATKSENVSRFSSRSTGERLKREFTPDKPTFMNEDEYRRYDTRFVSDDKENLKKR